MVRWPRARSSRPWAGPPGPPSVVAATAPAGPSAPPLPTPVPSTSLVASALPLRFDVALGLAFAGAVGAGVRASARATFAAEAAFLADTGVTLVRVRHVNARPAGPTGGPTGSLDEVPGAAQSAKDGFERSGVVDKAMDGLDPSPVEGLGDRAVAGGGRCAFRT